MTMLTKIALSSLFSLVSVTAMAQSRIVADVIYAGGMPMPNGPQSWGTTVYSDGRVVSYKNYPTGAVVKTTTTVTAVQMNKILKAGANLTPDTIVRDTNAPICMDAPYIQYKIANKAGQLIVVADVQSCVPGQRNDFAGFSEVQFLKALEVISNYSL